MEFAEIARHVGLRTGRGASDVATLSYVNEALALYSNDGDWPWLRATETFTAPSGGTDTWSIPYLCRKVIEVRLNGATLAELSDTDAGQRGWWSDGQNITFLPTVTEGSQVVVSMYRAEPPLVDTTSTPLISDLNIWPIIELATALALERAGTKWSLAQADVARGSYRDWVRAQRGQQHRTTNIRIRTRDDYPSGDRWRVRP